MALSLGMLVFPACALLAVAASAASEKRGVCLLQNTVSLHRVPSAPLKDADAVGTSSASLALAALSDPLARPLSVNLTGGLGNQLFQVAALLSAALDAWPRYRVVLPHVESTPWASYYAMPGRRSTYWDTVFEQLAPLLAPDTPDLAVCPIVEPESRGLGAAGGASWLAKSLQEAAAAEDSGSCGVTMLQGHFEERAYFAGHLDLYRSLFWNQALAASAAARLAQWFPERSRGRPVVAVHWRLGDFVSLGRSLAPSYFRRAVRELQKRLGGASVSCLLSSDSPQLAWRRAQVALRPCLESVLVPSSVPEEEALYLLASADAAVLSDSTFSYWAAVLGQVPLVAIPDGAAAPGRASSPIAHRSEPAWIRIPDAEFTPPNSTSTPARAPVLSDS